MENYCGKVENSAFLKRDEVLGEEKKRSGGEFRGETYRLRRGVGQCQQSFLITSLNISRKLNFSRVDVEKYLEKVDLVLIMTKEYGGGEIWFDDVLIRKDGLFVLDELKCLNPENLM